MSTLSHSRLFKATRRFIVAEVTLIIVIVILFTWSTYVLYKLFASDSDTLFGFNFKTASLPSAKSHSHSYHFNQTQTDEQLINSGFSPGRLMSQSQPLPVIDEGNLHEQLASYKDQILKELLARQRRLLGDDGEGRLASLLGLGKPNRSEYPKRDDNRDTPGTAGVIKELQQWNGGYKLPTKLDYLFDHNKGATRESLPSQTSSARLPPPAHSKPNSLVYLEDAPSLMQLSPASQPSETDISTTIITTTSAPETFSTETYDEQASSQQDETSTTSSPVRVEADIETTTLEPATDDETDNQQAATTPSPNSPSQDASSEEQEDDRPDSGDHNDSNDRADDQRVRNTVKTIDEEVDRMTQPSSGMVSQQDRPPSSAINTRGAVQFDDAASQEGHNSQHDDERGSSQRNRRIDHQGPVSDVASDLLVADNFGVDERGDSFKSLANNKSISDSRQRVRPGNSSRKLHPIAHALRSKRSLRKRSDGYDDDDADDDATRSDEQTEDSQREKRQPLVGQLIQRKEFTSNDPTFEELLAHKQLLDALQQNQLPSPVESSKVPIHQGLGNTSVASKTRQAPGKSGPNNDHQSADTHYSVDHGLLLYPSSDEEHHHKSKSHKSSKASKKKEKKKMTVAIKKGGHKSKKHKKEEKKYHKEKKFKGAKKGKKMKKGKGGKGGKKGKKLFKDKGYKKKGFKNTYVKNEFGSKKSYFDEFRDKDFKKKWKNFDDKYNYAQMKKWQAKDVKKAKKMKDHGEKFKKYDKGKWKKKKFAEMSSGSKKSKSKHDKDF